jgi:hypothetical protein
MRTVVLSNLPRGTGIEWLQRLLGNYKPWRLIVSESGAVAALRLPTDKAQALVKGLAGLALGGSAIGIRELHPRDPQDLETLVERGGTDLPARSARRELPLDSGTAATRAEETSERAEARARWDDDGGRPLARPVAPSRS